MQSSYWGYWLIIMGVAIVGLMISVQGITTNTTQDYYSLKEITDASMLEAVDYAYYRDYNEIKIDKEKFMEVFIRMLAEAMGTADTYEVNFYDLYEAPPKVSVEVKSNSGTGFVNIGDYDTVSRIDAVLQIYAKKGSGSSSGGSGGSSGSGGSGGSGTTTSPGSTTTPSTPSDPPIKPEDPKPEEPSGPGGEVADACKDGITTTALKGMHGTAMKASNIYDTKAKGKTTGSANPGTKFEILGEAGDLWAITYDGKCGWVDDKLMAINLKDYLPGLSYNITNVSGSIFKSVGANIPNLTGKKLYTNDFNDFVPATYAFAKKLNIAAANAQAGGDRLVIYEAYRPVNVSKYANEQLTNFYNSNEVVKYNIDKSAAEGSSWGKSWFLAQGTSAHNTGCAVDITLSSGSMPTDMHELSSLAIKYKAPGSKQFASTMTDSAKKLHNYMMNGTGLTDLASEWWHYQDNTCHQSIMGRSGSNFWSAV